MIRVSNCCHYSNIESLDTDFCFIFTFSMLFDDSFFFLHRGVYPSDKYNKILLNEQIICNSQHDMWMQWRAAAGDIVATFNIKSIIYYRSCILISNQLIRWLISLAFASLYPYLSSSFISIIFFPFVTFTFSIDQHWEIKDLHGIRWCKSCSHIYFNWIIKLIKCQL